MRGFPFFHRSAWGRAGLGGALCLGFFDIGGIIAVGGKDNCVFACCRQNVEFVWAGAADGAVIRQYRTVIQAKAFEDAAVGVEHGLVGVLQAGFVKMERVSVFHQEFPTPHHPKTRADFIAEFGLDLIDVER